jgi:hypothetical protein
VLGIGSSNLTAEPTGFVERGVRIRAISPVDGALFAGDAYTQQVLRSADDGLTWTVWGTPTSTAGTVSQVEEILVLRSGTLLASVRLSTQRRVIVRSTNGTVWTTVHLFPFVDVSAIEKLLHPQSWLQRSAVVSDDVFLGEYGDAADAVGTGMRLMRSTDDGQTWTAATSFFDIRHIHSVYEDPYNTGRLWLTIGDTGTQPRIGYSDNNGGAWTWVTQGDGGSTEESAYHRSRAVGLTFTSTAVFWASDIPSFRGNVYRYDRSSTAITVVAKNLAGTFFGAMTVKPNSIYRSGLMAMFSNQEPSASWAAGKDEYVRALVSGDGGVTWKTAWRWRRDQTNSSTSPPWVVQAAGNPDYCWVAWDNLEDSPGGTGTLNVKFQGAPVSQGEDVNIDGRAMAMSAMRQMAREFTIQSNAGGTGDAATAQRTWFVADEDIEGTGNAACGTTFAQDAANYWEVYVDIYRAGVQTVVNGPWLSSKNGAVTAYVATNPGKKIRMKAGDVARVRVVKTGTPANILAPCVSVVMRPIVGKLI